MRGGVCSQLFPHSYFFALLPTKTLDSHSRVFTCQTAINRAFYRTSSSLALPESPEAFVQSDCQLKFDAPVYCRVASRSSHEYKISPIPPLVMLFYTIIGGYVLTSVILFKYPMLIHKKKKVKFTCHHISHRGGAGESYENTMHAFKRAVAIGTEMLELDCQLTRDGEVVVSHDQNLLRSTGLDKNISEVDYKDLPLLKPRLPIDFDPDVEYIGSEREEERKFALLREVFEAFPKLPINIDIKINNDRLIAKVSDLIKEFNREEYTVWGNFSDEITKKCYKANPKVNLLFSMQRVTLLIFLMYTGLLPFVPLKESHLEIFLPSIYLRRKGGPTPTFLPLEKLVCRTINVLLMRPCLFNHLRARGIHVYFWVLNKDEEFEKAFDLGATGVMTDYPTKLKSFLKNRVLE